MTPNGLIKLLKTLEGAGYCVSSIVFDGDKIRQVDFRVSSKDTPKRETVPATINERVPEENTEEQLKSDFWSLG